MIKMVYKDGDKDRVLKGDIVAEDNFFITIENLKNSFRINKSQIILIKDCLEQEKEGEKENGNPKFN